MREIGIGRLGLRRRSLPLVVTVMLVGAASPSSSAVVGLCRFDTQRLEFTGTASVQAACLLRKVKPKGTGSTVQTIPAFLDQRVGTPIDITGVKLNAYLAAKGIGASQVGGTIPANADTPDRKYFVVHDTSSPELSNTTQFPPNINDAGWSGNSLNGWNSMVGRVNVINNRAGVSRTVTDFKDARSKPATKFEQTNHFSAARKFFVHVENIQPRIKPAGSWGHIAPDPGFSAPQLRRLALIYVAASVRSGRWLIPAFHFNIDTGIADAHDDPQKFELPDWVQALESVVNEIQQTP